MTIIAKTLLSNKTKKDRHVTWAGVCLGPEEAKLVDGLYPGSCKTPSAVKDMNADVDSGVIGVVLITDLPTAKPEEAKRKVKKPVMKLRDTEATKADADDSRKAMSDMGKKVDAAVFQQGTIDEAQPNEVRLKQPAGDEPAEQLVPKDTVFFGDTDPAGATPGDDPLQQLGRISAPQVTRGAAKLISEVALDNGQIAKLTQHGSVKKVTKSMVKHFLEQEDIDHGSGEKFGSDVGGNLKTANVGEAIDTDSFD